MSKYQLEIASNKRWEELSKSGNGCEHILDSSGYIDEKNKKIYVRHSKWPDLMKETIHHEIDHIFEDKDTDACVHGFKHKNIFKRTWHDLGKSTARLSEKFTPEWATKIPGIGPAFDYQKQVAQGGKMTPTLKQGVGILGAFGLGAGLGYGGVSAFSGAGGGAGGGGLSGFGNLLKSGAGKVGNALSSPFRGLGVAEGLPGESLQFSSPGNFASQFGLGDVASARSIAGGAGGGGILGKLRSGLGKFSSGIGIGAGKGGQAALGLGLLGASAGLKSPQVPDISANYDPLRQQVEEIQAGRSKNPLTQFSLDRLKERLGGQFQGTDPLISQQVNDSYNNLVRQYTSQYKMARPNADIATDTQFRLGVEEIERRRAQDLADVQQEEKRNYESLQTQSIAQSLGLESGTLQTLADIFQKGEEEQLLQLGLDSERIDQLRQILATAGYIPLASSFGLNQGLQFNPLGNFSSQTPFVR